MDERELEIILRTFARERYIPPERLIDRTKGAIRGKRLFHLVAFLSLAMQAVGIWAVIYMLMSPQVGPVARTFIVGGLTAFFGAIAAAIVAARSHVVLFFRRVERLTG